MPPTQSPRLGFLAAASASLALAAFRWIGANDRITLGMIGVGFQGGGHLRLLLRRSRDEADIQMVGVSDISRRHRDGALTRTSPGTRRWRWTPLKPARMSIWKSR